MQLYFAFKGKNIRLPIAHKYQVQSLIYNMLSYNERYSQRLHDVGYLTENKSFKMFTFGNLVGKYQVEGKEIVFADGFLLQIRSFDSRFVNALIKSAKENTVYTLCDNMIVLERFNVESNIILDSSVKIKMLSPITVHTTLEDGKTLYFNPTETEFYEAVKNNTVSKLRGAGLNENVPFELVPLCDFAEKNKTVTVYKSTHITAWSGYFRIESNPQTLNFLYDVGLGAKNSQGFGMFEILK